MLTDNGIQHGKLMSIQKLRNTKKKKDPNPPNILSYIAKHNPRNTETYVKDWNIPLWSKSKFEKSTWNSQNDQRQDRPNP